jgi:hypothetical protein
VYPNLAAYAADTIPREPGFGAPDPDDELAVLGTMFACHTATARPMLCAGWLAVVGDAHPLVRLAIILGHLDPAVLRAKPGWPALFTSYQEMLDTVGAVPEEQSRHTRPVRRPALQHRHSVPCGGACRGCPQPPLSSTDRRSGLDTNGVVRHGERVVGEDTRYPAGRAHGRWGRATQQRHLRRPRCSRPRR